MTTEHPATDTTAAPAKPPPTTTVAPAAEAPTDLRPAWERVAYAWLAREVDGGHQVDPAALAAEVSVNPRFTGELVRVLRAQRQRDPELGELRARLVRDQIIDAYLAHEVKAGQPLEPVELAERVGTSAAIARQWLHALRAQRASEGGLGRLLGEQTSHGQPSPEQLGRLQAHFAAGGHQQATVTGRPPDAERIAVEVERRYWTSEVKAHQPLDEVGLARELGVPRRQVAEQLTKLRAGPATARGRLEQLWAEQVRDPNRTPRSSQLAYRLGVTPNYVRHVTAALRADQGVTPLEERAAAAQAKLTQPPAASAPAGQGGDWRQQAACRDADPELFFPEESGGNSHQVTHAREICAACQVRQPCLDTALHGPQAHHDRHGIFAGTTARQRSTLRGRPSMAQGTRFLQDHAAAEEALALANKVSIDRAAQQLGVSKQALRRAFDHHGLGQPTVFQGGPERSRFYHDAEAARAAWQRAAEVGINQTRKELHTSDKALRTAWQRHGLGLPPRPTTSRQGSNTPVVERRLDPAFVQLNRQVIPIRARSDAELAQRVRRGEEVAALGPRVMVDLQAESRAAKPAARVWAVQRRAELAQRMGAERVSRPQRRAAERAGRHERARSERAERSARPHHPGGYRDER
jgi:WhiB family transcriptional regulator, redox-sensing transcriptional regulator